LTAIPSVELEIIKEDIAHLSATYIDVKVESIALIHKLFTTSATNQELFGLKIKIIDEGLEQKVVLSPSKTHTINGGNVAINSNSFEVVTIPDTIDLRLSPKPANQIEEILESEIADLTPTAQVVNETSLALIKKLFIINEATDTQIKTGLKIRIQKGEMNKVHLVPNDKYTINGGTADIFSENFKVGPITPTITDLTITANPLTDVTFTEEEILKAGLTNTFANVTEPMLELINKLFNVNGATNANLTEGLQIMAAIDADKKITVTLKAKENFTIGGEVNAEV
jgi:hypothetical protein